MPARAPSAGVSSSGNNRCLGPLAGSLPDVGFDDVEAGLDQLVAEVIHGPSVCRSDRVNELFDYRALEESDKQRAIGPEHAAEIQEGNPDRPRLMVDEGVPGENPARGACFGIEGVETADREWHIGIRAAGALDELGDQIHAADRKPSFGEEVRPLTRTATSVDDAALDPGGPCRHELTI